MPPVGKYDAAASMALGLISRKGIPVVLTRVVASVDPVSQVSTETKTPFTVPGVGLAPGKSAEYRIGSLAGRSVVEFYFALKGAALIPTKGDLVSWGGNTMTIFWSEVIDPAGDGAVLAIAYAEH